MPDFLPRRDADLLAWLRIFSARIAEAYAELGLTLDDAERLAADTEAFAVAFARSKGPSTESRVATAVKNDSRKRVKSFARAVARVVRAQFGIPPERLVCLGIRPAKKTRTPVARPTAAPRVQLIQKDGGIILELRDPDAPGSR